MLWTEHYHCNINSNEFIPDQLYRKFHQLVTRTHKHINPYYVSKDICHVRQIIRVDRNLPHHSFIIFYRKVTLLVAYHN